jgi:uncharacterized cupredoxin-like copper-binding protein
VHPIARLTVAATLGLAVVACADGTPAATPQPIAGTRDAPRVINLIAKDYEFLPTTMDLIPGETVRLQVVNGGLAVHEAIIGDTAVQDAWEASERATDGAPPGPTPAVGVPPGLEGLRIVVESGERVDVVWTVPDSPDPLIVGCHIPGHWERGMQVPVRWVPSS